VARESNLSRTVDERARGFARLVNLFCASPAAMALAFVVVVAWIVSGPFFHYSTGWQLVINTGTSVVTFLMVFVLNSAQSRDTAAINAKLDAVIGAIESADNRMIGLEKKDDAHAIHAEVVAAVEAVEAEAQHRT
jgi:low affinity Fe/Cu permease